MTPPPPGGLLGPPAGRDEPIRIGFQVWGQSVLWADLMAAGRRIEVLGFASLWANDHLMPILGDAGGPVVGPTGPVFEAWMTVAGWASQTSRIPVGVLVSGVGYRNAGLTVKMATALDHASSGRAILGLGAGWHEPEHRAFGYDVLPLRDRLTRLDDSAAVVRALLNGGTATAPGPWVRADGMRNDPQPVQAKLPFLIGGSGEQRTLRIVARDADIWNGEGDPATYARRNTVLDRHCLDIGRDPGTIRRTVGVPPICVRDTRPGAVEALETILSHHGGLAADARAWAESSPLANTEPEVARLLRAWRDAGAEEAIADLPSPLDEETLERLSTSVRESLA
ncbi:MAG: LLM class flavin-dependent oxidoreductase [Chloroflexi bacterium]|nr:LLM class flavin-dependent oxidoreductase [Chloroflexota bacterium]